MTDNTENNKDKKIESYDQLLNDILNDKGSDEGSKQTSSSDMGKTRRISEDERTSLFTFKDKIDGAPQNVQHGGGQAYYEYDGNASGSMPVRRKKKKHKKNYTAYLGIILATLVICVSLVLSLSVIIIGRDVLGIESMDSEFTINIPAGSSTADIADQLYDEGVIYYKKVFIALAKIKGADGNMYPGDIEVAYNMSYSDIIDSLMDMRDARETVTVTFPEGITLIEAAALLEQNGVCGADDFIYTFNSSTFGFEFERYVSSSSLKLYKYEGYLFPDTYEFYVDDTAYNVVKKIRTRTNEILNADVIERATEVGMTIDEVVTLASIVQLEAGSVDDMKNIASVFINRLNNPEAFPRLQSDATDTYIEDVIKTVLTVEYQDMYDAYDTYTCIGLPVGAICNPGADAINAVLYPNDTNYYYFCSNVATKETYYAETYEQHLVNCETAGITL